MRYLTDDSLDPLNRAQELRCLEEGCPPVETVVSLLREAGVEPLVFKVFKPVREVTRHEVEVAFARCIAGAPLQEHAPRSSRS